jgi:predicted Fe-S protein YdhL (DUF1289 family)
VKPFGSETFRKLNPHLFSLGPLPGPVGKQDSAPALDGKPRRGTKSQDSLAGSRPEFRVCIISCRFRIQDGDNNGAGCKALRDVIAQWLGLDDAERFILWEYSQIETRGPEGTIVKINQISQRRLLRGARQAAERVAQC